MSDSRQSVFKRNSHLIEGIVWLVFVLLAAAYTFDFDDPLQVYEWGPAHWPRVVLFGMFVACLWLLFVESRKKEDNKEVVPVPKIKIEFSTRVRMVLIFGLPVLYSFLIHRMGFLLITPFFLCAYMWVVGVKKMRTLIIMTVGIYAAIVIIFIKLIFTYLPPGAGVFNTINGYILRIVQ